MSFFRPPAGPLLIQSFLRLLLLAGMLSPTSGTATSRIYIALDDHTDYMWSGTEEQYRQAFLTMLDYYIDAADATAGNASPYQSRFNCDGSFWLWTFEQNRTPAEFSYLMEKVRSGHITAPLTALVSTYGGTPTEAILRGMYYSGSLERRFDVRFPLAVAMENQTMPFGLGALWAGSGALYTWKGICGCASQVPTAWDRPDEVYWWVGHDGSRLLTKWNSMLQGNTGMGGYAEARDPTATIEYVDADPSFLARYPYSVVGAFGKGWDDLLTTTQEFVSEAQAATTADRQVIVSNMHDFFQDMDATYGTQLPNQSCSYGNEWDVYSASMSEVSASVRRSVEKLRTAEALAAAVSLKDPTFMEGRTEARDLAWMNLGLYWEHDWTADGGVSRTDRANWQRRIAAGVQSYADTLMADASGSLGSRITRTGTNTRFYVFNPLSWTRSGPAEFFWGGTGDFRVVDLNTGLDVPSQKVTVSGNPAIQVYASDIPSLGYKVFEVVPGAGTSFSPAASVSGSVLENGAYRVTVSERGAITSLIDKLRGNRELALSVDGRVLNDLGSGSGSLAVETSGPVSVTLKATVTSPLAAATRITLYRNSDRVDIHNEITQNFSNVQTWGFGVNVSGPEIWHEELGAILKAKKVEEGGHYCGTNARYDWLSLNHFVDISDGNGSAGLTLSSADLSFMKVGNSTASSLDTRQPLISVLAGGQVDGSALGIPSQGGDSYFLQRFALRAHGGYDGVSAMKGALEHQNPLVAGEVIGTGTDFPEDTWSLASISHPSALIWSLKPAEEGGEGALVARIWNVSTQPASFSLSLDPPIQSASRLTHIETPLRDPSLDTSSVVSGDLSASISGSQLLTFVLNTQEEVEPPTPTPTPSPDDGGFSCGAEPVISTLEGVESSAGSPRPDPSGPQRAALPGIFLMALTWMFFRARS